MKLYECMWVVEASRGKEDFEAVRKDLVEMVEKCGGEIVNCDKWDERRLAYVMRDNSNRKHKRGLFVLSHFNAVNDMPAKLERQAHITDYVLRILITRDLDGTSTKLPSSGDEDMDFEPERMTSYRSSAWKRLKSRVATQYKRDTRG